MGKMPTHTPPATSIGLASRHIEHWYARFKKEAQ